MADNLKNRGSQDRGRINLSEDWEVAYWSEELGVSREQLAHLVSQYGNSAKRVREALGKA